MLSQKTVRIALAALILVPLSACAPKYEAKFKPAANEAKSYHIDTDQNVNMSLMGMQMKQQMRPQMDVTFTPTETAADGMVTVKMTYDDVKLQQSMSMGDQQAPGLDMGKLMGDSATKVAEAVKGQSVTARIAANGEVIGVDGTRELSRKATEAAKAAMMEAFKGQNLPPEAMDQLQNQDDQSGPFAGDQVRSTLVEIFDYFPPKPVKKGDTWTENDTLPGPGSMLSEEKFTVAELDKDKAVIKFERTIKPNPDAPATPMGPMKGKLSLSGTSTGTAEVDVKTGWLLRLDEEGSLTGEMKMEGGMMPGSMSIPMQQKWHTVVAPK